MTNLTEQQAELLSYVRLYGSPSGILMARPQLRTAQALESMGLVTVELEFPGLGWVRPTEEADRG